MLLINLQYFQVFLIINIKIKKTFLEQMLTEKNTFLLDRPECSELREHELESGDLILMGFILFFNKKCFTF
jgi:hypothetical protein